MTHPIQHISNTILLVMMAVEEGHEAEFDRWYPKPVATRPT
jgi:hypothetical protein